ncbi:MAG: efflux transporter periplasmic adaptor subunit [Gallionellales bacterium RIFCSPLOWO2_12_FULL_59_22]|nr:MAG: efflux transporter periplasmic adaptor subunit [Gallionellales bacterium RIFCSPLOWO2_02_FULL_59_110]OGT12881.1 MAG: efflux transporter periplasmic adaptor subunit [Gallionellales bacterium RIFCSPLOWO2_12_FULL_59_22]
MKPGILLFLLVAILSGCNKETTPAAGIERPALTMVVGSAATDGGNTYSGEIRARHEAQLGFRIGGKIAERLVDAGARVRAGQALMRLDPGDAGLQLSSAEAQHRLAEADAQRYRELRGKGFVSQAALDAKEAALKAASAQAGLARNQSGYTTLRADRAGVVAALFAEAGQVVAAGQPVLRLAQDGGREVAIALPESHLSNLEVGASAEITLPAAGDYAAPLAGRLRELSPAADPASRTYAARVALLQPGPEVALGMTARVRFAASKKSGGLLIPLSAIFQQGKQAAVWIVAADRTVSLRPVQVAAYRDDGAVIAGGLAAGERIVSNGVHRLAAGEKIRIIESGSAQ